jgi:long-chain acyl-CoA synthetase
MAAPETAQRRLRQTREHLRAPPSAHNLSIVYGPSEPQLVDYTLGDLLDTQASIRPDRQCVVVPFTNTRWTYADLQREAQKLAKGLLALGVRPGDRVGILAGNCEQYVAMLFGCGYVGAILVVLNSTYTAAEARYALKHSGKSRNDGIECRIQC